MLTVVSVVPLTLCVEDVLLYDPLVVPYSNHAIVDNSLALTVPFNVAELEVLFVTDPVVTVGDDADRMLSNFDTKASSYPPFKRYYKRL